MSDTANHSWFEKLSHLLLREPHSQKQLIEMLRDAQHRQVIDRDALQMIEGVLAVSDKKVRDVMVPRQQMIVVNADNLPIDVLAAIIDSQHSRFPVIGDEPDKVLGILLAKDLLPFTIEKKMDHRRVRDLIRPVIFIPESKRLDVLLKEFRMKHNHMAIVVDEYGSVAGLVTIEDVLEQIVGEIEDEYDVDDNETPIKKINDNTYVINALTPIHDFNTYFNTPLSCNDFDTIGGLVMQQFGRLPKRNEMIVFHGFEVLVLKATRRGIQSMQFKRI